MNFRSERVSKLISEELSKMILRELEFPNMLVTITEVDVESKLEFARVKVSVIPADKSDRVLADLTRIAPHLRHMLLKKINIKPMPQISFEIDHGAENAASVEKLLIEGRRIRDLIKNLLNCFL